MPVMAIELYPHQLSAVERLKTGSILQGGVGTGKSRTALAYYFLKVCQGSLEINGQGSFAEMKHPIPLYIITTARKRDTLDWEKECAPFCLSTDPERSIQQVKVQVDSWNNIKKYKEVKDSFFIFDEQRVIGSGEWVKSFLKITKANEWILLSATPGDCWMDYIPVFIANGFYKNRTEFINRHVVYRRFSKFFKVDRYVETRRLERLRNDILIPMEYHKPTTQHHFTELAEYNRALYREVQKSRWDPYKNEPIQEASAFSFVLRRILNSDPSRIDILERIMENHSKVIVFYNFNYELDLLREYAEHMDICHAEWNGHKHEPIPQGDTWLYFVQYYSGSEGWNCIETDTMIFYSQPRSWRMLEQATGRIDRLNTPYKDLYYCHIRSSANIDMAILRSLNEKKDFNESAYFKKLFPREKHGL